MKLPPNSFSRLLRYGALALACLLALPQAAEAKDHGRKSHRKAAQRGNRDNGNRDNGNRDNGNRDNDRRYDNDRREYSSRPRSSFVLTLGSGYAGRGYYYGPPNAGYYYQRSDVRYYATRESAPREYYSGGGYRDNSADASVQRALASRGYYQGSIDGALGPQSRRAISRYQGDNGLHQTGTVTSGLLQSLNLQ